MTVDVPAMRLALLALALSSACNGIEQSAECKQYLACVEAVTPGASANFASYADNGSCWSTDQRAADQCTAACAQGRSTLGSGAGAGKPECR